MNIGFRPRLKARPSLYDLVRNRNIDRLSIRPSTPTRLAIEDLPPLPASPNSAVSSVQSTPIQESNTSKLKEAITMAPKKAAKDADGEDQYGRLLQRILQIPAKLTTAVQVQFTRFLGTQKMPHAASHITDFGQTRRGRREHDRSGHVRIGEALSRRSHVKMLTMGRFESATTTWSEKSSESKRTELQFKYMRKQVWDIRRGWRKMLIQHSWRYSWRSCITDWKAPLR